MKVPEFLKTLRTRWRIVGASVLVALALALMLPSQIESGGSAVESYQASTIVLVNGTSEDPGMNNMETMSVLLRMGEIPSKVAESIGFPGDPRVLGNKIDVRVTTRTGIMTIVATAESPTEAVKIANAFASELDHWLRERREQGTTGRAQVLQERLQRLTEEIRELDSRIAVAPRTESELLTAERNGKVRLYGLISDSYQQLSFGIATPAGASAQVIQEASASPSNEGRVIPLGGQTTQLAVALLIGLAAGAALALVADRFDTRIRTRQEAARHFGFPILAQIPQLPRHAKTRFPVPGREGKKAADAFRMLATAIGRNSIHSNVEDASSNGHGSPKTVLVTSAGPGEGKTTVVANLAMAFSELGKKVVIVSCDFTRPRIHKLFGVENESGLSNALLGLKDPLLEGWVLDGRVRKTSFADIRLLPSGPAPPRVGELLSSAGMVQVLDEAKRKADIVLIDSPPVLVSDTAHLFPIVDAVLVVARSGKTTVQLAERAREIFSQFEAPVIGMALSGGSSEVVLPTSYYSPRVSTINEAPVVRRDPSGVTAVRSTSGESSSKSEDHDAGPARAVSPTLEREEEWRYPYETWREPSGDVSGAGSEEDDSNPPTGDSRPE